MHSAYRFYSNGLYRWFMKDVESLHQQCSGLATDVEEKAARKGKSIHRIETIHYHGNKFICDVHATASDTHQIVYKFVPVEKSFYCIAYDNTKGAIYHFRPHFFERYHERLELKIEETERLMQHYLHQNGVFSIVVQENKKKRFVLCRARFNTGAGYGIYDSKDRIYYFRTFISFNAMCFGKKLENNVELTRSEMLNLLGKKFKTIRKK